MKKTRIATIYDPRYIKLIKELILLRKNESIHQATVAEVMGITQPDISKIERFERRMDIMELSDYVNAIVGKDKTQITILSLLKEQ